MNIDSIRANVVGDYGLSSSNKYHVGFLLPVSTYNGNELLSEYLARNDIINVTTEDPSFYDVNAGSRSDGLIISYLADEVNIPGFSIATGEFKGFRPGINARYPHTRNPNECSIAFLQDMNHTPLRFIRCWSDYIFGFNSTEVYNFKRPTKQNQGFGASAISNDDTPYALMNYYDDYACDIIIDKLEPNANTVTKLEAGSNGIGSAGTHNVVTRTILRKAYPYLSNDFTVSNSPNQPVKVGVTFFYEYMQTQYPEPVNDTKEIAQSNRRKSVSLFNEDRVVKDGISLPLPVTRSSDPVRRFFSGQSLIRF